MIVGVWELIYDYTEKFTVLFLLASVSPSLERAEWISFMALRWFRLNRYAYLAQYTTLAYTYTLGFKF